MFAALEDAQHERSDIAHIRRAGTEELVSQSLQLGGVEFESVGPGGLGADLALEDALASSCEECWILEEHAMRLEDRRLG